MDRKTVDQNAVSAPMVAIGAETVLAAFSRAGSPAEIARIAASIGFPWCFWQSWDPEYVSTWDAMPKGFLEHYYGVQADRFCPAAVAIRRRWQDFTFDEARRTLSGPHAPDAKRVWQAFGIQDGAVVFGGAARICPP